MDYKVQNIIEMGGRFRLINEVLKSEMIEDDIRTIESMAEKIDELERVCEQQRKEIAAWVKYEIKGER